MITKNNRQIVLDTETTGINKEATVHKAHRIIEIGAVEIIDRRLTGNNFHVYLKPNRFVDVDAFNIHGISDEFLIDKPIFNDIANDFINYIKGSELIIHNAAFDVNFINYELSLLSNSYSKLENLCNVIDSLSVARKMFPGKRNNLDALCTRYNINNKERILHSALLDASLLAKIYLAMTGGQKSLLFDDNTHKQKIQDNSNEYIDFLEKNLRVILANNEEIISHKIYLDLIMKKSNLCLWLN